MFLTLHYFYKYPRDSNIVANEDLKQWISDMKSKGYTTDQIKNDLKSNGYANNTISDIFNETKQKSPIKTRNIFLMFIISSFTFGLYVPYWFYKVKENTDSLDTKKKIPLVGIIILGIIMLLNGMGQQIISTYATITLNLGLSQIVSLVALPLVVLQAIVLLFLEIRSRRVFLDSKIIPKAHILGIIFFGPYYLQSKVNIEHEKNPSWTHRLLPSVLVLLSISFGFILLAVLLGFTIGMSSALI